MPIKRPPRPVSPIDAETLAFATTGETAADSFLEFERSCEQWVDFWTEHETLLYEEARRRGRRVPSIIQHYPRPRRQRRT